MRRVISYIKIARPDHWFKNIFMVPGVIFGLLFASKIPESFFPHLLLGFASACMTASANYVINEWLDRNFDRHHPKKRSRPCVQDNLNFAWILLEYAFFLGGGLGVAYFISPTFFYCSLVFAFLGLCYNVPPLRTKERIYLDVLSESLNNPVRFILGWSIVQQTTLPPSSILIAYWMGGAFLMAVKRFGEYRYIGDRETATLYRLSFKYYTEDSLLISAFFYAISSAFFLGVFLVKYRIEYLICFPFFSILFAWYLKIGLSADSLAQNPEKLYKEAPFLLYIGFLCTLFIVLTFVDLPFLKIFLQRTPYPFTSTPSIGPSQF